jgi:hypothetical protein
MDRDEALGLLDAKLDEYRHLSYAELAAKIGHEEFPEAVGPSGTEYQMEIQIRWDHKPGGDVRVMASIDDGTFSGAFKPVCSDLIVRPDEHDSDNQ